MYLKILEHLKKEKQADGILGMPLKKITSLEKNSLKNEIEDLNEKTKNN